MSLATHLESHVEGQYPGWCGAEVAVERDYPVVLESSAMARVVIDVVVELREVAGSLVG